MREEIQIVAATSEPSYYRARYYDAGTGRFEGEDPLRFIANRDNFYEYAFDNPVDYSDPSGMQVPVPVPVPVPEPFPIPGLPGGGLGSPITSDPWGRPYCDSVDPTCVVPLQPPLSPNAPMPPPGWDKKTAPDPNSEPCDGKGGPDCRKATPFHLQKASISDPHAFKQEYLGKKAPISRYDICACNDGSIIIKPQGKCDAPGPGIETGARWK